MMFSRAASLRSKLPRVVAQSSRTAVQSRLASSSAPAASGIIPANVLGGWYNTFGKSTATYASWLVMLIVVGEYATGKITDVLWEANNRGKTFTSTDWSKFDQFEDEDEEDEDDDDDDDE